MAALVWAATATMAAAQLAGPAHVKAELVPMTASAAPGSTVYVALREKIEPGWHVYWKNAGDAGKGTEIAWTLPQGWKAGDIVWPKPGRMPQPPLMTYGYENEVLLPVALSVPASAEVGSRAGLGAHADYLVCKDICVPESSDLSLSLPIAPGPAQPDPKWGAAIARTLADAPKPAPIEAAVAFQNGVLKLAAVGGPLKGVDPSGAYFYPATGSLIVYAARQGVERGPDGLTFTLTPAKAALKAPLGTVEGLIETGVGTWQVTAKPGPLPAGAAGLGAVRSADDKPARPAGAAGLPLALLLALLGGLTLNLMPCVFPVLSMKAAALANRAHQPAGARRDGLMFLAGVIASFLVLALALIASKAAGHALGWGFQLQSPAVTAFLTLLTLAVALNLSGVFEAGLSLQGVGAGLQRKPGPLGAFLTGVLAVVVGAPCTAPFMASAMGYALTAGPAETLLVFLVLGLGLALPFTALSLSPALLGRLPKPGPWMDTLRKLLAFPMYATAAFMAWVFAQQTASTALGLLFAAAVALGLFGFLFGRSQQRSAAGQRSAVGLGAAVVSLILAGVFAVWGATTPAPAAAHAAPAADLPSEPYSPTRLAELRAQRKPVLVNFTAAWCVTCRVNEEVAFSSRETADAFARTGTVYMVGDWTRQDPEIAKALAEQGRSGVPLYLMYAPGAAEPKVLPQILTSGTVVKALDAAAGPTRVASAAR